jgi:hypothetical protein
MCGLKPHGSHRKPSSDHTSSVLRLESVELSAIARSIAGELKRNQPERKVDFVIPG